MRRKIHREDILNAGLNLMFLNGYNATGIKDITDAVDIPKGSFYNHFGSKEEFALEVVKQYCDNGVLMYRKRLLDSPLAPLDRVADFFDVLIASYQHDMDCKLGCVMGNFSIEMSDVNEKFRALLDEEFDRCEDVFRQCLVEAQTAGALDKSKDTNQLAAFILNSWHGAMLRMKSTASAKPLEDCRDMILTLLKT